MHNNNNKERLLYLEKIEDVLNASNLPKVAQNDIRRLFYTTYVNVPTMMYGSVLLSNALAKEQGRKMSCANRYFTTKYCQKLINSTNDKLLQSASDLVHLYGCRNTAQLIKFMEDLIEALI